MKTVWVLTHEYSDKSGFRVCGATDDPRVADAWLKAGTDLKVYRMELNKVESWDKGYPPVQAVFV